MAISNVEPDGALTAAKINEVIDAINALQISWVSFNGVGPISIRAMSGNISGVSRVGDYTKRITFATPRTNTNYAVVGNCSENVGNDTGFITLINLTTDYVDVIMRNDDGGAGDCLYNSILIVG